MLDRTTETVKADFEYEIINNKVIVDNSLFYASAYPAVLGSSGWAEFEFELRTGENIDIDFCWGFNTYEIKPRKPVQAWLKYLHHNFTYTQKEKYGEYKVYNVVSYENLGISNYDDYNVDWGTSNNNYLFNVTIDEIGFDENWNMTVAFSSYDIEENNYILFGNYIDNYHKVWNNESYKDWKRIDLDYDTINFNFRDMTTWYLVKNQNVVSDKLYKIRYWVDIPFGGLSGVSGKYWWAFKRSSDTLQEAINNDRFFYLDPWWDSNWNHYRVLTIESDYIDNSLVNFPVLVNSTDSTLISKCDSGDSVRFLSTDNSTEFYYEIEEWTDAGFSVWVNISEIITSGSDYKFLMYYNNSAASDNQDAENVWDSNYVGVWHMDDNTTSQVQDSTVYDNDGTKIGANEPIVSSGGKIGDAQLFDGSNDYINCGSSSVLEITSNITTEVFLKTTDVSRRYQGILKRGVSGKGYHNAFSSTTERLLFYVAGLSDTWCDGNTLLKNNVWYYFVSTYNGSANVLYLNDTIEDTEPSTGTITISGVEDFFIGREDYWSGNKFSGTIDEVRISNVSRNASWIKACFHSQNQSTHLGSFLSWGSEQTYSAPSGPPSHNITISNLFPVNNSNDVPLQPTAFAYFVHENGSKFTIRWYNDTILLGTETNVNNGTYSELLINFTKYNTAYTLNVSCNDTHNGWWNFTFDYTTISSGSGGGGSSGGRDVMGVVGIFGGMLGIIAFVFRRKKK